MYIHPGDPWTNTFINMTLFPSPLSELYVHWSVWTGNNGRALRPKHLIECPFFSQIQGGNPRLAVSRSCMHDQDTFLFLCQILVDFALQTPSDLLLADISCATQPCVPSGLILCHPTPSFNLFRLRSMGMCWRVWNREGRLPGMHSHNYWAVLSIWEDIVNVHQFLFGRGHTCASWCWGLPLSVWLKRVG